jgi:hypothetical protein
MLTASCMVQVEVSLVYPRRYDWINFYQKGEKVSSLLKRSILSAAKINK